MLSPMKMLLPFASVPPLRSWAWATSLMRLTPGLALPAPLHASFPRGQAGEGRISRLPFQSES